MKSLNEGLQMRSDWYLPICTGKERLRVNGEKAHTTQKPEALLYRILLASSKPGDVVLDPFLGSGTTAAVAKRLHRHWIGIEREAEYVKLARQRIAAVQPGDPQVRLYTTPNPRKHPRLPFGVLVEHGLLKPGQRLYFGKRGDVSALVLADGTLEYNGQRGSIHQIARAIRHAPSNGWEQWHYEDLENGTRRPIDHLRAVYREMLANEQVD